MSASTLREQLARYMDPQAFIPAKRIGKARADTLKARREIALKRAGAALRFFAKPENGEALKAYLSRQSSTTPLVAAPATSAVEAGGVATEIAR